MIKSTCTDVFIHNDLDNFGRVQPNSREGSWGGIEGHGIEDLSHSQAIINEVLKQFLGLARKAGLANIELIQGVMLSDKEWTPQNNLVTATNKLNRNFIVAKFQKDIDAVYGKA
ncbi:hypothetical protein DL98DRAFT_533681 [Cadophora sp. DSE1049]|nr:hypothetical protein DL98DRAFT_533681 [Cadophora sp. DSE1049]